MGRAKCDITVGEGNRERIWAGLSLRKLGEGKRGERMWVGLSVTEQWAMVGVAREIWAGLSTSCTTRAWLLCPITPGGMPYRRLSLPPFHE